MILHAVIIPPNLLVNIGYGHTGTLFLIAWSQCSADVFKRAGCHLKRAHLVRRTVSQKGTFSAESEPSKGHI